MRHGASLQSVALPGGPTLLGKSSLPGDTVHGGDVHDGDVPTSAATVVNGVAALPSSGVEVLSAAQVVATSAESVVSGTAAAVAASVAASVAADVAGDKGTGVALAGQVSRGVDGGGVVHRKLVASSASTGVVCFGAAGLGE